LIATKEEQLHERYWRSSIMPGPVVRRLAWAGDGSLVSQLRFEMVQQVLLWMRMIG
jgi:hypothetical protein